MGLFDGGDYNPGSDPMNPTPYNDGYGMGQLESGRNFQTGEYSPQNSPFSTAFSGIQQQQQTNPLERASTEPQAPAQTGTHFGSSNVNN